MGTARPDLAWGRATYIMGIVNVTPDSFSGDGCPEHAAAIAHGLAQARAGCHILDVGGESTRPGAAPVPAQEEMRRVVPVIAALARKADVPISVDTTKPEVAEAALDAGACVINDVWGVRHARELADLAARRGAALVVMHNREAAPTVDALGGMYPEVEYGDLIADVRAELLAAAARAEAAGVPPQRIWVDPGVGFGKTPGQSLDILRHLAEFRGRYPLLVGPSRKSFIGRVTGRPAGERDPGTAAAVALAVGAGADIVRVHDVAAMAQGATVAEAITRGWPR